jgi:uncharacterized protein (TIGR03083 family)
MTAPTTRRPADQPVRPALDHEVAMAVAATEYQRVVDTLEQLSPGDWSRPTDCTGWDVRAVAGHTVGMTAMAASVPQLVRQQVLASWRARRTGQEQIDALTALQVQDEAGLSTAQLVDRMRVLGPRGARGRRRMPGAMRQRLTMPEEVNGVAERWTLGYLTDVILTRDPFMHRLDIARATGVQVTPTAEHEGVIVADVVQEWRARHGRPVDLELTGPAGGRWREEGAAEPLSLDAFDFCRIVSGRGQGTGLLATQVPF